MRGLQGSVFVYLCVILRCVCLCACWLRPSDLPSTHRKREREKERKRKTSADLLMAVLTVWGLYHDAPGLYINHQRNLWQLYRLTAWIFRFRDLTRSLFIRDRDKLAPKRAFGRGDLCAEISAGAYWVAKGPRPAHICDPDFRVQTSLLFLCAGGRAQAGGLQQHQAAG